MVRYLPLLAVAFGLLAFAPGSASALNTVFNGGTNQSGSPSSVPELDPNAAGAALALLAGGALLIRDRRRATR